MACFYLLAQLSNDISDHRREMNAAAYRAQLYFDQREALLNYLADSVLTSTVGTASAPSTASDENVRRIQLGVAENGQPLYLLLSERSERTLQAYGATLIHVGGDPALSGTVLDGRINVPAPGELSPRLLQDHSERAPSAATVYWLASSDAKGRIYLYRAIDEDDDNVSGHWLVLSLDAVPISSMTDSRGIGDFALLDSNDHPILGNRPDSWVPAAWLKAHRDDAFAFIRIHRVPRGLALVKSVGEDGWRVVYSLPIRLLFQDLAAHLAVSLLLCAAAVVAMLFVMRRIDLQLIQPAHSQHRQLLENLAFISTVFEMAPVGICVIRSQDASVILENQVARNWLGTDTRTGDWAGRWRPDAKRMRLHLRRGRNFTTRDGRRLHVLYAATRYYDADAVLCVFNDISRHRQIQETLKAARQAANEANAAKSTFVATMSHEIRTPLFGVLGTLELLGNTHLDTRQARYLRTIQQSSSVLLQLISDILDVSRIESGRLSLSAATFSPQELAENTLSAYAAAATLKGLRVMVSTDPRLPAQVLGDEGRIRQVLGNLLSNAIKFTHSGRIVLRVRQVARHGDTATISWQVADTGIGIAAEEQARLFEPFRQVGEQDQRDGSGLGLSISDHLARLMNGNLRLVSERGLGSSFTMTLPLNVATDADAGVDDPHLLPHPPIYVRTALTELTDNACLWFSRWGADARHYCPDDPAPTAGAILIDADPDQQNTPHWNGPCVVTSVDADDLPEIDPLHPNRLVVSMFSIRAIAKAAARLQHGLLPPTAGWDAAPGNALGLRVLVAEDNPINRVVLKEQLEFLGCTVVTAIDGIDALHRATAESFDMVLTDINMPGMTGQDLTRQLRRRGHDFPVVGATANATPEERERCLAMGMNDYVVKPISIGTLRSVLGGLSRESST